MNGLEGGTFGVGQDVIDQLPTTTAIYVECGFWTWPFCD